MAKSQELIQSCQNFYNKIKGFVNDEDVCPNLGEHEFKEYVRGSKDSKRFDIPSFRVSIEDLPKVPHITIRLSQENIPTSAEIFFNGRKGTRQFKKILDSIDKQKIPEFVESLKDIGLNYVIEIRYGEKIADGSVDWKKPFDTFECDHLENKTNEIMKIISLILEKRESNQQFMDKPKIATTGVSFARINLSQSSEEELKKIFSNLAQILKATYNIEPKLRNIRFINENTSE